MIEAAKTEMEDGKDQYSLYFESREMHIKEQGVVRGWIVGA